MNARLPADFAVAVRDARARLGWTQSDVAERAGVTRQLVAKVERDPSGSSLALVLRVLSALGVVPELASPRAPQKNAEAVPRSGQVQAVPRSVLFPAVWAPPPSERVSFQVSEVPHSPIAQAILGAGRAHRVFEAQKYLEQVRRERAQQKASENNTPVGDPHE